MYRHITFLLTLLILVHSYSSELSRREKRRVERLYSNSLKDFNQGNYYESLFGFGLISSGYSDLPFKDSSDLFFVRSLAKMDMREAVIEKGNLFIDFNSSLEAELRLELMKIAYCDGNYYGTEQEASIILQGENDPSVMEEAYYYLGQQKFNEEKFEEALVNLMKIPETSSFYSYALHTIAVAYANLEEMDSSFAFHRRASEQIPVDFYEEEIINKSRYLCAVHLWEEKERLLEALEILSSISYNSRYYERRLELSLWMLLHLKNCEKIFEAADLLLNISSDPIMRAEALLIKAYAEMIENNFSEGFKNLVVAQDLLLCTPDSLRSEQITRRSDLQIAEERYYNYRSNYSLLSSTICSLAYSSQENLAVDKIDSLKGEYLGLFAEVSKYIDHKTVTFSEHGYRDQLLDEIQYGLGNYHRCRCCESKLEREELHSIDDDIEALRKQLQELQ